MSQSLHWIPAFDGINYGYGKAHMCFFLKSIDVCQIVETGWIKLEPTTAELSVAQNSVRPSNDTNYLCQALSPSEFARISNCESAKKAWQILETTYEGTKLVKSAKLQMLISLLVFYIGYILDDKNTLCNGCYLNRISVLFRIFKFYGQCLFQAFMSCHKFLEDVYEDSMQISKSASRFLCNRLDGPLKASGCPIVSRSFSVEDVWTSVQHCPDARSSFSNFYSELDFSRHLFGKFLQDVRTMWQLVQTLSSISEYFRFPLQARKGVAAKTVRALGQAVRTWTCYGKNCAILERQSQNTVRTRLSSVQMLYSPSPNLSRIRFSEAYIKRALSLLFVRIQYRIPQCLERLFRKI
jgi:hypothetical protein